MNSQVDFLYGAIWVWFWKRRRQTLWLTEFNGLDFFMRDYVFLFSERRKIWDWVVNFTSMAHDLLGVDCMLCDGHFLGRVFFFNDFVEEFRVPSVPDAHLRHCFVEGCSFYIGTMYLTRPHLPQPRLQLQILLITHRLHMHTLNHLLLLILLRPRHPLPRTLNLLHLQTVFGNKLLILYRFLLKSFHNFLFMIFLPFFNIWTPFRIRVLDLIILHSGTHLSDIHLTSLFRLKGCDLRPYAGVSEFDF